MSSVVVAWTDGEGESARLAALRSPLLPSWRRLNGRERDSVDDAHTIGDSIQVLIFFPSYQPGLAAMAVGIRQLKLLDISCGPQAEEYLSQHRHATLSGATPTTAVVLYKHR